MSTKTTGQELLAFYKDRAFWHEDDPAVEIWHEDLAIKVNGELKDQDVGAFIEDQMKPGDQIVIVNGYLDSTVSQYQDLNFETFFKRWRKNQSDSFLSVQVPKDKQNELEEFIKKLGGKVN